MEDAKNNDVISTGTGEKTLTITDNVASWLETKEFISKPHPTRALSPPSIHATVLTREITRPLKLFKSRARARAGELGNLEERLGSILTRQSSCSYYFDSPDPKFDCSPLQSPSPSPPREKTTKFKHWKEGTIAPGSDVEESAEESEKSPLKLIPQRQTFQERLTQSKAMLDCWAEKEKMLLRAEQQISFAQRRRPELHSVKELVEWAMKDPVQEPVEEEPALGKRQPQMVEDCGSESEVPTGWPIPSDPDKLLDQIMLAVPQDVLDFEGSDWGRDLIKKKEVVRTLLWKRSRPELEAVHKKLFEHHPRDLPIRFVGQPFIDSTRLIWANKAQFQAGAEDSGSDNDMGKKQEMIEKVRKIKLAKYQGNRPTPERKTLTNAEVKRQKLWGTIDPEEAKRLKEEKKRITQEAGRTKKVQDQKEKRRTERELKAGKASTAPPQD